MKDRNPQKKQPMDGTDLHLIYDMLSISFDGNAANQALYKRAVNVFERQFFKSISFRYLVLFEKLLESLECLPKDTGTMNPETGYIAKAYLAAMNAPDEKAPKRVMMVNKQALKRMFKLAEKLNNRQMVNSISQSLFNIQTALDTMQYQTNRSELSDKLSFLKTA